MIEYLNELLGKDYTKTKNAIMSCKTRFQLNPAKKMIELYRVKNPSFEHQYTLLLEHYVNKMEEFNPVKKNQEIPVL